MMDRQQLRGLVGAKFARFIPDLGKTETVCVVCNRPKAHWDLHEAIVKRSAVPVDRQKLIFVTQNCVPVCRDCHMGVGQTQSTLVASMRALFERYSAQSVGKWYRSLIEEHGLSIPGGMLIPPKLVPIHRIISEYIPIGAEITQLELPEDEKKWLLNPATAHARDFRALCGNSWQRDGKVPKKKDRPPVSWAGYTKESVVKAISEGYWALYLCNTLEVEWTKKS